MDLIYVLHTSAPAKNREAPPRLRIFPDKPLTGELVRRDGKRFPARVTPGQRILIHFH